MAFPDPGDFERAVEQRARTSAAASDPGPGEERAWRDPVFPHAARFHADLDATRGEYLAKLRARLAELQSGGHAGRDLVESLERVKEQLADASMHEDPGRRVLLDEAWCDLPPGEGEEDATELLRGGVKDVSSALAAADEDSRSDLGSASASGSSSSESGEGSSDAPADEDDGALDGYAALDDAPGALASDTEQDELQHE